MPFCLSLERKKKHKTNSEKPPAREQADAAQLQLDLKQEHQGLTHSHYPQQGKGESASSKTCDFLLRANLWGGLGQNESLVKATWLFPTAVKVSDHSRDI